MKSASPVLMFSSPANDNIFYRYTTTSGPIFIILVSCAVCKRHYCGPVIIAHGGQLLVYCTLGCELGTFFRVTVIYRLSFNRKFFFCRQKYHYLDGKLRLRKPETCFYQLENNVLIHFVDWPVNYTFLCTRSYVIGARIRFRNGFQMQKKSKSINEPILKSVYSTSPNSNQ